MSNNLFYYFFCFIVIEILSTLVFYYKNSFKPFLSFFLKPLLFTHKLFNLHEYKNLRIKLFATDRYDVNIKCNNLFIYY